MGDTGRSGMRSNLTDIIKILHVASIFSPDVEVAVNHVIFNPWGIIAYLGHRLYHPQDYKTKE